MFAIQPTVWKHFSYLANTTPTAFSFSMYLGSSEFIHNPRFLYVIAHILKSTNDRGLFYRKMCWNTELLAYRSLWILTQVTILCRPWFFQTRFLTLLMWLFPFISVGLLTWLKLSTCINVCRIRTMVVLEAKFVKWPVWSELVPSWTYVHITNPTAIIGTLFCSWRRETKN